MRDHLLLTFNPGSSSIKIGLFQVVGGSARRIGKGIIDFQKQPLIFCLTEGVDRTEIPLQASTAGDLHDVLEETLGWLARHFSLDGLAAAGHRVVHGGERFTAPVHIDDDSFKAISDLIPLAPLHQPQSVRLIQALRHLRPGLMQTASFDTAFHVTQEDLVRRFALPRALHDRGIKRYGFHGLSYKFIAGELERNFSGIAKGRVIVAHLGSGASLCALQDGISRDTSMSFSTLDGIPMATRCGTLDPGVLLHLLGQEKQNVAAVQDMLYHQSGLLGVSGISGDSRVLLESDRAEASEALGLFALRVGGEIARLAATLGGLDALVFTAGIGEHQPEIRAAICGRLAWLGVKVDGSANGGNAATISSPQSKIAALIIATDEEQVIADEAVSVLLQA
ncbi:acetate kinase [Labrys miyagiensis]|uniref:Acetate kinase n=1 Tax=Labrys miyagiensis TaxID=346912 RepID=A0ABQ6CDU0_9HYPH|nr:acetate/propionate family kinase [Labrys miyagiensis]GLS18521.1 acetate kinase [Labrys miyagiensis]